MQLSKKNYSGYQDFPEKVLQFGEGNFLRCFVDWMFHRLNKSGKFNGSVVAVQPIERGMVNMLNEQDADIMAWAHGTAEPPERFAGPMIEALKKLDYIRIVR